MKQNKKRTLTTFFGIVFMVLLMTCVFVGKNTGFAFMEQVAEKKDGKWHVSLYDTSQQGLDAVKELDYVEQTAVSANYGSLEFPQSKNVERPYLTVKAYNENCFDWMNIELLQGSLPRDSSEIVISESAIQDGAEVNVGDTISGDFFERSITGINENTKKTVFPFLNLTVKYGQTVDVPQNFPYFGKNDSFQENKRFTGKTGTYKVVGIVRKPGYETFDAAGYTAITGLTEKEIGTLDTVNVSVKLNLSKAPQMFGTVFYDIADNNNIEFNDYLLAFSGNSSDSSTNRIVGFMMVFFVVLIMAASVILIYNVFNISFQERCRYLGMLSSVGATGKQKRSSIYYEAFTLLIPALPVGIFLGMAVIKAGITAIKPLLGKFMNLEAYVEGTSVKLQVSPGDIGVVILVCAVTVLISAFLPARKIGKIGPIASIRGNQMAKEKTYVMRHVKGAEFMLAANTVKRQRKKTKSLTMAAVTFMVIMAVTSYGAVSVKSLVTARVLNAGDMGIKSDRWEYHFGCLGNNEESYVQYDAVKEEILKHPGVSDAAQWYDGMFSGRVRGEVYSREYRDAVHEIFNLYYHRELSDKEFEEKSPINEIGGTLCILGVDDATLYDIAEKSEADVSLLKDKKKASAIVVRSGQVSTQNIGVEELTPERFRYFYIENMTDLKQGETMDVELYSAQNDKTSILPVTIAGFADAEDMEKYVWFNSQFLWLIVGEDTCLKMNECVEGTHSMTPSLYFKWDGSDPAFFEKIRSLCEENYDLYFGPFGAAKQFGDAIIAIVNVMAVCFAAVVSVICLLNLFNSIRGRIMERRGEFAMLRSVGMTGRQIRKMLLLENVRVLGKSLLIAVVIIVGLIAGFRMGMEEMFGHTAFILPWGWFAACVGITVITVCWITWRCFEKENAWDLVESIREVM